MKHEHTILASLRIINQTLVDHQHNGTNENRWEEAIRIKADGQVNIGGESYPVSLHIDVPVGSAIGAVGGQLRVLVEGQ
jgi:hypothetical protein